MLRQTFNERVLPKFIGSLCVATIGAAVGTRLPSSLFLPIIILEFVFLLLAIFLKRRGMQDINPIFLWIFILLSGMAIGPFIQTFISQGSGGDIIIAEAFGITALAFLILGGYTYVTGKDFRGIGPILFVLLIILVIASVVGIFVSSASYQLILSSGIALVFCGYILYDISNILRSYSDDQTNLAVLSLYIDFINLFINILEILGILRSDRK